jgi:uncharacterized surface protein with fasciclin (FAS1) repeats
MKKINFIGRYTAIFLSVLLLGTAITSCKEDDKDVVKPKTITDVILTNSQFSILKEIIVKNNLTDEFRSENITFFAPSDAAFKLSNITSAMVTAEPDSGRAFVYRHVLKGKLTYDQLKKDKLGNNLTFDGKEVLNIKKSPTADSLLIINGAATVVTKNVNADNGMIQVVNRVLYNIK